MKTCELQEVGSMHQESKYIPLVPKCPLNYLHQSVHPDSPNLGALVFGHKEKEVVTCSHHSIGKDKFTCLCLKDQDQRNDMK